MVQRVVFTGEIGDKRRMEAEYRQAKVFCLTSAWESFGIVLVEALRNGCFILSTNVGAANDLTCAGNFGDLFPVGDAEQLAKLLMAICNNQVRLKSVCEAGSLYAEENFRWDTICRKIADRLA